MIAAVALSAFDVAVLIFYLTILAGMGVYFARRRRDSGDYFLAGQKIPWWAAGISIFGTTLSAITFLAIPARSYAADWSTILLNGGIVVVAPLVAGWDLPIIRQADVTTAYEFLEQRFGLSLRLFAAVSFSLFQLARMGIVILLPALARSQFRAVITTRPFAHLARGLIGACAFV